MQQNVGEGKSCWAEVAARLMGVGEFVFGSCMSWLECENDVTQSQWWQLRIWRVLGSECVVLKNVGLQLQRVGWFVAFFITKLYLCADPSVVPVTFSCHQQWTSVGVSPVAWLDSYLRVDKYYFSQSFLNFWILTFLLTLAVPMAVTTKIAVFWYI
jgi:hypothetical protein